MNSTFRNLSTEKSHTKARPVVMQILPSLVTGGVERGTIDVTQALTDAGWKAIVVSNGGPMTHEITRAGGLHIDLPIGKKNPLTAYLNVNRLVRLIREHQVDILHARSRLPAWSGLVAAARTDIKFITTFHGNYSARNSIKRYYNSVMARGDRVIAISEFIRQQICEKYGESDEVINCIMAHHEDESPDTIEAIIVMMADAISSARPGARRESTESYVKRLEKLEAIASSFSGVEKVYAIQAGREIRVIVRPDEVDDKLSNKLAFDIAKQIESEVDYPGEVQVSVVRETRFIEVAH